MKGLCVSKGSVRGKAIIVDSVFATKTIAPGTILVMKTLDRKLLVSLSKNVVGVIAESGNIGSHGAGILRSLKIPCVLRIKDAVSIINDGQEIVIEGEKGEVHIGVKMKFHKEKQQFIVNMEQFTNQLQQKNLK